MTCFCSFQRYRLGLLVIIIIWNWTANITIPFPQLIFYKLFYLFCLPPLGSLSIALASKYTNSSIISMTDSAADAESHLKEVKRLGLWNNVITDSRVDEDFSRKLVESPDFLRYQFIGESVLWYSMYIKNSKSKLFFQTHYFW